MDQAAGGEAALPAPARQRRRLVLAASVMATFMAAVESTIVATAMPTIVADLGGFSLFSWVFAAYLLAMAVTIPLYGRLADIYGRKRVFFAGTGIFLAGTSLCGFASTMGMLVLFRAIQGLGAGAIQPIASTVVGDIYTPAERARVQGLISSVFGVSAIVGPALGAFIVEHLHWSLVFWVNLPIGAAMLVLVQAGRLGPAAIGGLAAFAAAALCGLIVQERRAAEPIVPFRLWRLRVIALANLGTFGTGASMMAVSAFLPAYVQGVMGQSAGVAGAVLGCQSVSWTLATFAAARVMIRTSYRVSAAMGGTALLLGGAMLALLRPDSSIFWAAGGSRVMGVGMGFCNPSFLVSIQASVGWGERGVATGGVMFMRMMGQSLGAAVFGAVVNFGIAARAPGAGDAVNRLMEPALRAGLGAAEIARLSAAVAASVHEIYLLVLVIAVATLVVALSFPKGLSPTRSRQG